MIANIALGLFVGLVAGLIVDRFRRSRDITSRAIVATAVVAPIATLGYWASPGAVGALIAALAATVLALAVLADRSNPVDGVDETSPETAGVGLQNDELG